MNVGRGVAHGRQSWSGPDETNEKPKAYHAVTVERVELVSVIGSDWSTSLEAGQGLGRTHFALTRVFI